MNVHDILEKIIASNPSDWHVVAANGIVPGPVLTAAFAFHSHGSSRESGAETPRARGASR